MNNKMWNEVSLLRPKVQKAYILLSVLMLFSHIANASNTELDEEINDFLNYGMEVESAVVENGVATITTTGATYVLNTMSMDMYRRIDPKTNHIDPSNQGRGRKVAELIFSNDIGSLSIKMNNISRVIVESDKATFDFKSDSFFFITAKAPLSITHRNLIGIVLWNAPLDPVDRDLDRMWTDGYGGSLLAYLSETTKGQVVSEGENYAKVNLSVGDSTGHMVFPPKRFDFNRLYGRNARPFVNFMSGKKYRQSFLENINNFRTNLIRDGFSVIAIWNDIYDSTWEPEVLTGQSNILGYKITEPDYVENFVNIAHAYGFKVIAYCWRLQNGSSGTRERWIYPKGHAKAGQYQPVAVTLKWMREFQDRHNFDGWYFDGGVNCGQFGDLIEDYQFTRQLRTDVGDDGILFINEGSDTWEQKHDWTSWKANGLRAIMIDAYADYVLTGEGGPFSQVDDVHGKAFRFFVSCYGMSQAFASFKNASDGKAAISLGEKNRLLAENLNGCQRNYYYGWSPHFKPAYNVRKAEFASGYFNPDVDWPLDPDTGWFRKIRSVRVSNVTHNSARIDWVTNAASDSEVMFTSNGVWWGSKGPDGVVSDSKIVTSHSLLLTGLKPNTTYSFRIRSNNRQPNIKNKIIWGDVGNFTTLR
ncbi:MAG: fibronectin type III domain-containing protein [Planctomycetota bacterium]|jgi:hypothetical protein